MQLTLNEIVNRLQDRNLKAVAAKSGVSYQTIYNIAKEINTNPNASTLSALSFYFQENK